MQFRFPALPAALNTPRIRALIARGLARRREAAAAGKVRRAARIREPMDEAARARLERARRRTPIFMVQERNRRAKARQRARELAADPEGYRRRRREEMRAWRTRNLAQRTPAPLEHLV